MGKKFGFSWSWRRALGISSAKQKIARMTGIPTTRGGRERKIGRLLGSFGLLFLLGGGQQQPSSEQQGAGGCGCVAMLLDMLVIMGGCGGLVVLVGFIRPPARNEQTAAPH